MKGGGKMEKLQNINLIFNKLSKDSQLHILNLAQLAKLAEDAKERELRRMDLIKN